MQRSNITLRLSGDAGNTIQKQEVSPAEIVILRSIHGKDAVVDVKPTHMCKTAHRDERRKLSLVYGDKRVEKIFPGAFSKLPVTLKEIEPVEDEEEIDQQERPGKAVKMAAVAPPVFDTGLSEEDEAQPEKAEEAETEDA